MRLIFWHYQPRDAKINSIFTEFLLNIIAESAKSIKLIKLAKSAKLKESKTVMAAKIDSDYFFNLQTLHFYF